MPRVPVRPLWLVCCLWTLWVAPALQHPQCLDFKPPFRPLRELSFCVMYKDFGCCDTHRDQQLMDKYYLILDQLDASRFADCAGFVFELLCQVGWGLVAGGVKVHNMCVIRVDA